MTMTRDAEALYAVWEVARHRPAWLAEKSEWLNLNAEDEDYLGRLEDTFSLAVKDIERGWRQDGRSRALPEVDHEWAKERRKEYLEQEFRDLGQRIEAAYADYANQAGEDGPAEVRLLALQCSGVRNLEKRRDRLTWELGALSGKLSREDLPAHMIDRARAVPLDRLVEPDKRGYILCPLHEDRKPSMWVRGGFGYCFSCGGHLDAIGYLMRVRGLSFRGAVEALQ